MSSVIDHLASMHKIHSFVTSEYFKIFSFFAIGFTIGWVIIFLTPTDLNEVKVTEPEVRIVNDAKRIRILCYVHTSPKHHANKAIHVFKTWGKHCDKVLFASTSTDPNLRATGFNVTDSYASLWGKTKYMMQHIYTDFIDDYDWFFKADDDTFLIAENLRYYLSAYSTNDPIYFGHKFNSADHMRGFSSGGSGYVMSRKTVRIFVENVLRNKDFMRDSKKCHIKEDEGNEDWYFAQCLDQYNVYAVDTRDLAERERFIPLNPEQILFLKKTETSHWYWRLKYYSGKEGADCCSNNAISFHYVNPKYQYTMYYLTYRLRSFGLVNALPSPPQKKSFLEVANALDSERFYRSLTGS